MPRVLLIGDSIARGYAPFVEELLAGRAEVEFVPCGPSDQLLDEVDAWLARRPSVVHFNTGLWDIRLENGRNRVPVERYGRTLRRLAARMKQSGAQFVFATTTPVPDRVLITPRRGRDAVLYSAVARRIMEESQVPVVDLHGAVLPRLRELQHPSDVHFNEEGCRFLAKRVAATIERLLDARRPAR